MNFLKREWRWLLGLVVLTSLIWGAYSDRLNLANWAVPPTTSGDSLSMMAIIKAAGDGDFVPLLHKNLKHLGAPGVANWDDYPIMEEPVIFLLGLLSKFFGIAFAANAGVLIGRVLSAVAFYVCCRYLRYRRPWALAGAILFSFAYFHLWRSLPHLLTAYSFTIPLAILSWWLVGASRRLQWWDQRFWICVVSALLLGFGNPYNLNVFLQLLCLTLAAHYLTRRRKVNLQIGAVCLVVALAAFFISNLDTFFYQAQHGKNVEGLPRAYFQSELYALKPLELLIPPPEHKLGFFGALGSKYAASAWLKGEMFSPYLGLVGLVALGWLCWAGLHAAIRRTRERVRTHLLHVIWVFLYSVIGGFNCLLALGGLVLFRSSNRYSIFISALVLLFLVGRLSRWKPRKPAVWHWTGAVVLMVIGLADQLITPGHIGECTFNSPAGKLFRSDQAFMVAVEAKLPPGAMLFQLPVMEFPEAGWVHNATDYEMLRPYLYSKNLRYSYGHIRGRQLEAWQHDVERLEAPELVAALEKYGFAAIYIARKGYPDNGEGLLKKLAAAGRAEVIEDDAKEQVCVLLKPSPNPIPPPSEGLALITPKAGWIGQEKTAAGSRRWAVGNAELQFFNGRGAGAVYSIKCQVLSASPRQVMIQYQGKELWRANLGAGQAAVVDLAVDAAKGNNSLVFATDAPPVPAGPGSSQRIAFAVVDLKITCLSSRNP